VSTISRLLTTATLLLPLAPVGTLDASAAPAVTGVSPIGSTWLLVLPIRWRVLQLTNERRVAHGCKPVRWNDQLGLAAQRHTWRMAVANTLSHQLPGEPDPGRRIRNAGYAWTAWGENVAVGQPTPREVVRAWMHSPGHRAIILTCAYEHLGVGYKLSASGAPYWTQDFGRN